MKGFHCLVISFLLSAILAFLGCKTNSVVDSQMNQSNHTLGYDVVVATILDYYNAKMGYSHGHRYRPCYKLYPMISTNKQAGYYTTWNNQIEYQRKLPAIDSFYDATVIQRSFDWLSLDSIDLRAKVNFVYPLSEVDSLGEFCIEWDQSGEDREGTLWFSPVVGTTKQGYYHVALYVYKERDPWEYLFLLKMEQDQLRVVDYYWDDNWPTRGIPAGVPNLLE